MLHSNAGELHQLFSTFNRVWGAGGDASLSLKTVDGKVSAVLEVQLGPPADLRPGAPVAQQQAAGRVSQQFGEQHCRRRRGPGRQARDAARREAWRKRRQEPQLSLPVFQPPPPPSPSPPPPPADPPTVVREKTFASAPVLGEDLPLNPDEATPSLPAPEGVSSPASPPPLPLVCDLPRYSYSTTERCGKVFTNEDELRIHAHGHYPEYCIGSRYSTPCPYKKCKFPHVPMQYSVTQKRWVTL